jgi:hypothetical protein
MKVGFDSRGKNEISRLLNHSPNRSVIKQFNGQSSQSSDDGSAYTAEERTGVLLHFLNLYGKTYQGH